MSDDAAQVPTQSDLVARENMWNETHIERVSNDHHHHSDEGVGVMAVDHPATGDMERLALQSHVDQSSETAPTAPIEALEKPSAKEGSRSDSPTERKPKEGHSLQQMYTNEASPQTSYHHHSIGGEEKEAGDRYAHGSHADSFTKDAVDEVQPAAVVASSSSSPPSSVEKGHPVAAMDSQPSGAVAGAGAAAPPLVVVEPPSSLLIHASSEKKKKESYFVYVNRLTLIDTAEETSQWANRAKHQWGGDASSSSSSSSGSGGGNGSGSGVSIRISSQSVVRGRTPPKPLQFSPVWTGVTWSKHDAGILVPLEEDAMLVVEIVVVTDAAGHTSSTNSSNSTAPGSGGSPERVLGMGLINAQAIVDEERQWGKFCVHLLPSLYPLDSLTVHAVVEFSILSSTAVEEEEMEAAQRCAAEPSSGRMSTSPMNRGNAMDEEDSPCSEGDGGETSTTNGGATAATAPASLVVAATGTATSNPGGGDVGFTTLEYNYGAVRVSTVDFFYPPFFLSGTGQYIVSNVLCAMNMTESSALAMQLVPLKEGCDYLQTSPASVITVRPQQRAYFTATWDLKKKAYRGQRLELELLVHGTHTPSARILLQVHHTTPHSTASDVPYMYWVNNTCLCNRQMVTPEELPCLKEVLPVYRLLSTSQKSVSNRLSLSRRRAAREANAPPSSIMGGAGASSSFSPAATGGGISTSFHDGGAAGAAAAARLGYGSDRIEEGALDVNASFVLAASAREDVLSAARAAASAGTAPQKQHPHPLQTSTTTTPQGHTRRVFHRGPLLNIQQRTCHCSITLGPIRGFPFLESLSGQPNAFRIAITLLDKVGWKVLVGETRPSYPTASGSLQWNETLHLQKWPGAVASQFCRLHLSEVRSTDGDETPIGAGLISVGNLGKIHECVPLSVAFSVYETYSQYDQMISPSLLMKDITLRFSDIR